MKVLLINAGTKPVPAVSGGGVEMLIDLFVRQHVILDPEITVATVATDESIDAAKEYKNIDFIFLKSDKGFRDKLKKAFYHFVYRAYSKPIGNAFIHSAGKRINFNQYELIVVENGVSFGSHIRRKGYKGKLVLHLHNDWINTEKRFSKEYADSFDEIWTISDFIKQQVDRVGSATRTRILYNGVDFQEFDPTKIRNGRDIVRNTYGIGKDDFVFTLCSRIVEEKGILEAQKAFGIFVEKNAINKAKLMIIGGMSDDSYCSAVKQACDNNTIVVGYIEHNELPKVLYASDVCLTPTVHLDKYIIDGSYCGVREGLNVTVIEALALGIPVIATDSGGMPEIVEDGYNGVIISSNEQQIVPELVDAMEMVYDNLEMLRGNCISSVQRFSKDRYYATFIAYITDLLRR